jgi:hypothetical protein
MLLKFANKNGVHTAVLIQGDLSKGNVYLIFFKTNLSNH